MRFIDEVTLPVKAGDGGNGIIAFRRERYKPRGGPCGGDGGQGGDVVFVGDENVGTLLDLQHVPQIKAKRGQDGQGNDCNGRGAPPLVIRVPVGTVVHDEETGELVGDITENEQNLVVAKGGRGGRGNIHFATSSNRAPRKCEAGHPGEERVLKLELKLLADVGLLGLPNVGKSTLISRLSAAKPKIADYPFTTLVPNLGVVRLGTGGSFVMADIPGLIRGASRGAGLGIRFLKHVQRSAVLLHICALGLDGSDTMLEDFEDLSRELESFDEQLARRPRLIAVNKIDVTEAREAAKAFEAEIRARGFDVVSFSASTGEGLDELKRALEAMVREARADAAEQTPEEESL